MGVRRGRKAISVVFVASIASGGLVLVANQPTEAASPPTLTIPGRVYPEPGQALAFTGTDPVSDDNRAIVVDGLVDGPLGCAPDAGNHYDVDDCPGVDISMNTTKAGLLRVDGNSVVDDNGSDVIWNQDNSVVVTATDPQGLDSQLFTFRGPAAGIANILATLQLVPCTNQQGTLKDPAPVDPAESIYEVNCGDFAGDPALEPAYEERESSDGQLPHLHVLAIQGDASATASGDVYIKFEGSNDGPTLSATTSTIDAAAGATTAIADVLDVDDTDMCSNSLCPGDGYDPDPDNTRQEGDDAMLLVVWLAENNCGTFDPRGDSFFPDQGGASSPSLEDVVKGWTGLDLNDSNQAIAADAIWTAVETTLSPDAAGVDLSGQGAGNVTAWAGIGGIDDVKYTLGGIDYNAPGDDTTCHLDVAVSDLGNNGAPLSYVGSPFGPETPYVGEPGGNDVPYEVPNALATSTSLTLNVKDGHPAVTIDQLLPGPLGSPAGPNKPSSFTITFGDPIDPASFDTSDLTLTTSNAAVPGLGLLVPITPGVKYSVPVTATGGDTTLKLEFTGSACAAGHFSGSCDTGFDTEAPTYSDNEIDWDETGPTVTIDKKSDAPAQDDPTSGPNVVFTVKFSDTISTAPIGFDASDVDVSTSTTGAGTHVSNVTQPSLIDLKTYEVTVTGMTVPGDVIATVKPNAIVDQALNLSDGSTSTDNIVEFDNQGPDVTIDQGATQTDPTIDSPIVFDVHFTESVSDFATGDVTFSGTALPTAAVVTGSGQDYTVAVSGMSQDGDVTVSIAAGKAHDGVGNPNTASTTGDDTVTFDFNEGDSTPPTVTINKNAGQADPTSSAPIVFDVVFSEPVADFATGDVTLTGTAGATTAVVTGSGMNYSVAVSGMTTDGTVIASINAGKAHDAANNGNLTSTSSDNSVDWVQPDLTGPTVTIDQALGQSDPDDTSPILFTVHFSEDVADFATGDVTLSGTAGATTAVVTGSLQDYTVTVSGMTQPGTVIASINPGVAHDASNNPNDASTSTDHTVTWNPDVTGPTVTINQAVGQSDPTTGTPILFTVVFNENVSDFATGDVTLGGTAGATTAVVTGSGINYTVAVSGMTVDGTVTASVNTGVAHDASNNPNDASTSTDNTVTFDFNEGDSTHPTVTINQAAVPGDPSSTSPIVFDVVFSEPVPDFATGDVTVSGTAGATTGVVTGSGMNYSVSVSDMAGNGTVIASIAAGVAHDAANNPNDASTSTDNTVTYDTISPTVTITPKVGQADPTNGSPVSFTITFSEPVVGLLAANVNVTAPGSPVKSITGGPTIFTLDVTGMNGTGNVTANVGGSATTDLAGNASTAAPSPAQVAFDNVPPTVTINQAAGQADPTSSPSINFTVVFSESVTGFASDHVALSGTAGATTADITGSGTTYNVAVSGMTQSGTVIVAVLAGAAHDAVGNLDAASSSSDNTVQFNKPVDSTPPTVTIDQAAGQTDPTVGPQVKFTAVFSEAVGGFTGSDVVVSGTAGATAATVTDTGDHMHFDVVVTSMLHSGTVIATIPGGVATDAALNANTASTSSDNTVTFNEAVINVSTPGGTVTVTVTQGGVLNSAGSQALQVPPPNGVTFPFGQLSFTATGPAGGLVTFQLQLPSAVTDYYKLVSSAWQKFTFDGETGAVISNGGTTITVTIRDNGRGDSDPTAGVMTDPAAPAVLAQVPTTTTTAPTTSPTTAPGALPPTGSSSTNNLIVLASLLVGIGCLLAGARRRQSKSAKA